MILKISLSYNDWVIYSTHKIVSHEKRKIEIVESVSTENLKTTVSHLSQTIGIRVAGSNKEKETALWLDNKLQQLGYKTELQEFILSTGLKSQNIIAYKEIFSLIEKMSRGATISNEDMFIEFNKLILSNKYWRMKPEDLIARYTEKDLIRLGIHVKCKQCGQSCWYKLDEIGYTINCQKCGESFAISHNPADLEWKYKSVGPFGLGDMTASQIPTLLVLRFIHYLMFFYHQYFSVF